MGNGRLEHFSVDVNDPLFVVVEMSSPHGDRVSYCETLCVFHAATVYVFNDNV